MNGPEETEIKHKPVKRKWLFWLQIIIIIYCGAGIALYYLQDRFLFHPKKLDPSHVFIFDVPFEELKIPFNKTDTMSMVKFFPKDSVRKGVILYYHGNMDNIERYAGFAADFTKRGYEVWMPDYPGFGKSTGERTEDKMYEQAYQVRRLAESAYQADSVIIYGKSMGTGIAAYVASTSQQRQLILETPYYSIPDLFSHYAFMYPTSYMSNYKIPLWRYLKEVKSPVTIFHGTDDGVIPFKSAAKLKQSFKPSDRFITIPEGKHNNLAGFDQYKKAMDSLLQ